jgi:O-antigen/teichoic acid export membrane protein
MIKQILHTFFTKILTSALGFATIIIISQILGTEQKGEQALIVFDVYILMIVFTLIGNSTLIYLTPRHSFNLLILPSFLWIGIVAVLILIFLLFFPSLAPQYTFEMLTISILASINEINQFILLGREKIEKANIVKLLSPLITIILLVTLWLCNRLESTSDFVIALGLSYIASTFYSIVLLKNDYKGIFTKISTKELKEITKLMLVKGTTKQIGTILQTFNYRLIFLIIEFYFGASLVGIYSNAVSLTEAVLLFGSSLALVQYSKLSNTQSNDKSRRLTIKMTKINALVTFLGLLVLCCLPTEVYIWLFGEGFEQIDHIIRILAFGILLLGCSSNFTQYFSAHGNFYISTVASLTGFIATISVGLWLVPLYSLTGAAITAVVSFSITSVIEFIYFLRWKKH